MAEKDGRGSVHPGSKPWQRADTANESGPWLYHQQMLGLGYPRDQAQDGMGAEKEEPQTKRSFMSSQPLPFVIVVVVVVDKIDLLSLAINCFFLLFLVAN